MKNPDEIKRKLITCTELNMPQDIQHRTMLDALALIQQLEAKVPRWISVKERPPEGKVFAANFTPETYGYGEIIIGYVEAVKALSVDWEPDLYVAENDCEILRHVTHWMPLPEPPEEETK